MGPGQQQGSDVLAMSAVAHRAGASGRGNSVRVKGCFYPVRPGLRTLAGGFDGHVLELGMVDGAILEIRFAACKRSCADPITDL